MEVVVTVAGIAGKAEKHPDHVLSGQPPGSFLFPVVPLCLYRAAARWPGKGHCRFAAGVPLPAARSLQLSCHTFSTGRGRRMPVEGWAKP